MKRRRLENAPAWTITAGCTSRTSARVSSMRHRDRRRCKAGRRSPQPDPGRGLRLADGKIRTARSESLRGGAAPPSKLVAVGGIASPQCG